MFRDCNLLIQIPDINNWDTKNVTNMNRMFSRCTSLESLDCSKWNTKKVTSFNNMFAQCGALQSLKGVANWGIANNVDRKDMFKGCKEKLDVPELLRDDCIIF